VALTPGRQNWVSIHESVNVAHFLKTRIKDKTPMIISINAENYLTKLNMLSAENTVASKGNFLKIIKDI
jgi:hypothetical protein